MIGRGAPEVLRSELDELDLGGRPLAIGTTTDPYQPAEGRYRLTRGILEVLATSPAARGLQVELATRSTLVARDIDLLAQLGGRAFLSVHVALTTLDPALCRKLEPDAPATQGVGLRPVLECRPGRKRTGLPRQNRHVVPRVI